MLDGTVLAADHQAVAALESPDAAACPDVKIVYAARFEHFGSPDIIVEIGVAAVNNDVVGREVRNEVIQCRINRGRGYHQPDSAWPGELIDEVLQRTRSLCDRSIFHACLYGARVTGIADASMTGS